MRKMLLLLAALSLVAGTALAGKDEVKPTGLTRGLLDCTVAIPIACGDVVQGDNTGLPNNVDTYSCTGWNEAGGEVVYELVLDGDYAVTGTIANMATDLDIWFLEGCEEAACVAYGNVTFTAEVAAGTYYIVVDGYNGAESAFDLTVDCSPISPPPPTPDNDTCDGAIDLQEQGLATFDVPLATGGYTNAYSQGYGGCTGYNTNGPDAVYKIWLAAGESFTVTEFGGTCDMAMHLITDCLDDYTSCVAGSDNCCAGADEVISYVAAADGWYYLIVDAYSSAGCDVSVTIDAPVGNEAMEWGQVKSLY